MRVTVGPSVVLTHTADTTAKYETITGDVTGATGIVIVPAAAGTATTILQTSTVAFNATETSVGTVSGPILAMTALPTNTQVLYVLDDGAYFSQGTLNKGITSTIAGENIAIANVVVTDAGVYQFGDVTEMLAGVPVYETSTGRINSGNWNGAGDTAKGGEAFVAGTDYARFVIEYDATSPSNATTAHPTRLVQQAIWYDDADGDEVAYLAVLVSLIT